MKPTIVQTVQIRPEHAEWDLAWLAASTSVLIALGYRPEVPR